LLSYACNWKEMISWFYAYVEHIEIKTKTVNIIHVSYLDLSQNVKIRDTKMMKLIAWSYFKLNTNIGRIKVDQYEKKISIGSLCPILAELYYLYHKGSFHLIYVNIMVVFPFELVCQIFYGKDCLHMIV
jgi:hypothetical protein